MSKDKQKKERKKKKQEEGYIDTSNLRVSYMKKGSRVEVFNPFKFRKK